MLTRRNFARLTAGAGLGLVAAPSVGHGQALTPVRLGNAAGIIDPQITFLTVGQNPRTPFYAQEGCAMEIINLSSAAQSIQAVVTGQVETTAISPVAFLNVVAKNPGLDLVFPYCWLRQPHWYVAVKPDSPVRSLQELKGKQIGIRNQGDTGYIGARAMFKELGLDPDKDVEWISIGEGGQAGQAIHGGRVDAMAFWDSAFARIELAGFPLRALPNTPGMQKLFGNCYGVRKSSFQKNRDLYARFFRAMAKSTVFAYANVDTSIKLHYEIYPESKPKGKTDAEAMAEARRINDVRRDKWLPGAWQSDKRFGATSKDEWEAQVRFVGLEGQITDVTPFFTNEILDEVNRFDRAAIEKLAQALKV